MPIQEEQTAHRQHPVPQNIMSVEFKLVGDLTVRQFVYLIIGGITVYLSFISKISFLWKWGLILFGGLGSLALAFVPLGDRGLDQWIKNFVKSVSTPTQRVWRKNQNSPEYFLADYAESLKNEAVALAPVRSRKAVMDYFESSKMPQDILRDKKEEDFLKKINFDIDVPSNLKSSVSVIAPPKTEVSEEFEEQGTVSLMPEKEPVVGKVFEKKEVDKKEGGAILEEKPPEIQKHFEFTGISVGRPLKHIPLEGEIVLPKRSLRIKPSFVKQAPALEDTHKKDLLKQAEELRAVLKKAEEKMSPEGAVLPANELVLDEKKDSKTKALQEIVNTLRKENKKLFMEIENLKGQMKGLDKTKETYKSQLSTYAQRIKELEARKNLVEETIHTKVSEEPVKMYSKDENAEVVKRLSKFVVTGQGKTIIKDKEPVMKVTSPNVIWGVVRDKGGRLLENATLIVKDANDVPVRALKTNKLGQFISTTPLFSGSYKIEVLNSDNSFAIMNIILEGKVLKPLEFLAINK